MVLGQGLVAEGRPCPDTFYRVRLRGFDGERKVSVLR